MEAKANINARCMDGCTPVMYASAQGWTDIIEMLYDAGADLTIKDEDGDTALKVTEGEIVCDWGERVCVLVCM